MDSEINKTNNSDTNNSEQTQSKLPFRRSRLKAAPNVAIASRGSSQGVSSNVAELTPATEPTIEENSELKTTSMKTETSTLSLNEAESISKAESNLSTSSPSKSILCNTQTDLNDSPTKKHISFSTENQSGSPNNSNSQQLIRFRSRFPKHQPNIAASSGLERIRRLSGHYNSSATTAANNEHTIASEYIRTPPQIPQQSDTYVSMVASPYRFVDQVLSPRITESSVGSPMRRTLSSAISSTASMYFDSSSILNNQTNNTSFKQILTNQISSSPVAGSPAPVVFSQPATPYTPMLSGYHAKFPKEQIKNVIKYIAMQKLKKIESESLKERRRTYKKNNLLAQNKQISANATTSNDESNDSSILGGQSTVLTISNSESNAGSIDRSKLRMRDFLYYKPKNKKQEEIVIEASEAITESSEAFSTGHFVGITVDHEASNNSLTSTNESISSRPNVDPSTSKTSIDRNYAPQLKFSEDGRIIINEESLVIQRENIEPVYNATVIETEYSDNLTYNSYRKHHHTKKWTERETAKFYKALSMIGTDFTMIQRLFSTRSRDEIKRKFKREEKLNQALIDKILSKTDQIELSHFVSSGDEAEDGPGGAAIKKATKRKKLKEKNSNDPNTGVTKSKKNDKKPKLKRVKKRQFVESESEDETPENSSHKTNEQKKKASLSIKSKEFISDEDSEEEQSNQANVPELSADNLQSSSQTLIVTAASNLIISDAPIVTPLPSVATLFNCGTSSITLLDSSSNEEIAKHSNTQRLSQVKYFETNKNNDLKISKIPSMLTDSESDSEEKGDELVLDLDANSIHVSNSVLSGNNSVKSPNVVKGEEDNDDEDEDDSHIILDMDSKTFIKNTPNKLTTSSIVITKILPKNN